MIMLHLIGIGPGDPELLTVKAARLLKEADVIYVPQSREDGRSVARTIIAPYANDSTVEMAFVPMRQDRSLALSQYQKLADLIVERAKKGLKQVFVTLGDPMVYSTALYLSEHVAMQGVTYEFVPGIPSFIAAANCAGISLGSGRESFVVTTMPAEEKILLTLANNYDAVVIMKINKKMPVLLDYIQHHAPKSAVLVHRLGMKDEQVFDFTEGTFPEDIGYLSTAVIRQRG